MFRSSGIGYIIIIIIDKVLVIFFCCRNRIIFVIIILIVMDCGLFCFFYSWVISGLILIFYFLGDGWVVS